jgi:5'-nucleotidase
MWPYGQESAALLFNVNVPNRPATALAGIRLTSLGVDSFLNRYQFEVSAVDPYVITATHLGATHLGAAPTGEPEMGTDAWAVEQGYVSITPIQPLPELMRVVPWYNVATQALLSRP